MGRLHVTEELRQLRLHTLVTIAPDVEDDSDEEPIDVDDVPPAEEEKEEEENRPLPSSWSKECTSIVYPTLTVPSGPQLPVHHAVSEKDFFHCLLTQQTLQVIAANTTAYAHHKDAAQTWTTSAEDCGCSSRCTSSWALSIFRALTCIGRSVGCNLSSSTRSAGIASTSYSASFTSLLPRLLVVKHTVLDKVAPLITACQHSFSTSFLPAQVLVVDESMVPFKGREPMKQYLPDKPTSWGYKVWCVASDKYMLNFSVFKGRQKRKRGTTSPSMSRSCSSSSLTDIVVISCISIICSSPWISSIIWSVFGMRACGTVRPERKGLPADVKEAGKQLAQGCTEGMAARQPQLPGVERQALGLLPHQPHRCRQDGFFRPAEGGRLHRHHRQAGSSA